MKFKPYQYDVKRIVLESFLALMIFWIFMLLIELVYAQEFDFSIFMNKIASSFYIMTFATGFGIFKKYREVHLEYENTERNRMAIHRFINKVNPKCLVGDQENGVFRCNRLYYLVSLYIRVETTGDVIRLTIPKVELEEMDKVFVEMMKEGI